MAEVFLEIMKCHCGRGGIGVTPSPNSSGGQRITGHKCTGQWDIAAAFRVDAEEIVRQIREEARRSKRSPHAHAPGEKGGA